MGNEFIVSYVYEFIFPISNLFFIPNIANSYS